MTIIEVNNLTKVYRLYNKPKDRLREFISLKRKKYHHEFYALRDVSFNVEKGQTVGIIGQNGSGKSTLLKMICGVIQPTRGGVKVSGHISSLLELGTGFNPEFTGRENVYMNGALMGFSQKEIDQRFSDIESFAEIGEFIDQPVKTYSSGMFVRLAFAAAIHVNPDILILDEILAVGDENFQSKCRQKIQELRQKGKTIILVSHDHHIIEYYCNKVCLLHEGKLILEGKPVDVFPTYFHLMHGENVLSQKIIEKDNLLPQDPEQIHIRTPLTFKRWGTKEVEITNVSLLSSKNPDELNGVLKISEEFAARIEFVAHKRVIRPTFGIAIFHENGTLVAGTNTMVCNFEVPDIEGRGAIEYSIGSLPLLPGRYLFTAAIYDSDSIAPYDHWEKCVSFTVAYTESVKKRTGILYLNDRWRFE